MSLKDARRLDNLHYAEHVFLARIAGVKRGGFMVERIDSPGSEEGPYAYRAGFGAVSVGALVKCQRVGGVTVVEYIVNTTGAFVS